MKRQASREIARVLEGYKRISELAGNAVFILDIEGRIFDVNRIAERLMGYTKAELLNMHVRDLHVPEEQETAGEQLRTIAKKKNTIEFVSRFRRKNGEAVDVKITADRFKFKKDFFIIGIVRDISPYRKTEEVKTGVDTATHENNRFFNLLKRLDKEYIEAIHVLIDVSEARDPYTMKHSVKVTNYAVYLAEKLKLPKEEVERIRLASMLHDIGKIGIKTSVLMKPSPLTKEEFTEIKQHPQLGVEIIKPIKFMSALIPIIKHHHENYDGTGYPDGLKGKEIPSTARILAVADAYDALTSDRAYRKAYSSREALKIMEKESGKKFDPQILKIFALCLGITKIENVKNDRAKNKKK